jgi:hypothetical protein
LENVLLPFNTAIREIKKSLFSEQDIQREIDDVEGYYSFYGFEQKIKNCLDRLGMIGVNESKAEVLLATTKNTRVRRQS